MQGEEQSFAVLFRAISDDMPALPRRPVQESSTVLSPVGIPYFPQEFDWVVCVTQKVKEEETKIYYAGGGAIGPVYFSERTFVPECFFHIDTLELLDKFVDEFRPVEGREEAYECMTCEIRYQCTE